MKTGVCLLTVLCLTVPWAGCSRASRNVRDDGRIGSIGPGVHHARPGQTQSAWHGVSGLCRVGSTRLGED